MNKKAFAWVFDKDKSTVYFKSGNQKKRLEHRFSFKLTRYKNNETYEESLRVESLLDGKYNGYIDTSIEKLDKDLVKLKRYGVVLSNHVFIDIKQQIENIYLDLDENDPLVDEDAPKMVDNKVMETMLEMIGETVDAYDIKDGYYNIRVKDFDLLIEESLFNEYDLTSIKKWLSRNGYIKCGTGRLTRTIRLGRGKPARVISINANKIKPYQDKDNEDDRDNA